MRVRAETQFLDLIDRQSQRFTELRISNSLLNRGRILCQPSLIGSHHMTAHIPFQKRRSVNNVLLTFSTCIRRPFCARLGKGHSRLTRSEQIGSAGTSTSRNWTIGFGPKSHVRPCALSTWRASEWTNCCTVAVPRVSGEIP